MDRETAVARKHVEDSDKAMKQEQEDMKHAEMAGLTTWKPERTFEEMLDVFRDSLSDHLISDDEEDGEDTEHDQEDTELGTLSEDGEPSWVMGTISKMVQQHMECVWQKQMKIDDLTQQPAWGDVPDHFCERDERYGTAKMIVPAVVMPQTVVDAAAFASTTFGAIVETLDIVPRKLQILHVNSQTGCSYMRLGSGTPQSNKHIKSYLPDAASHSSPIKKTKSV